MIYDLASRHRGFPQWGPAIFGAISLLAASAFTAAAAWTLDPVSSSLKYQSVKKNTVVETNKIRNLSGTIQPDGAASVSIDLNSVDTGVDIRDTRMRFLSSKPLSRRAVSSPRMSILPAFADLPTKRRIKMKLAYSSSTCTVT